MDNRINRRRVLSGGGIVLAGLTAGAAGPVLAGPDQANAAAATGTAQTAGIGWELTNLDNDGADIYFEIVNAMTMHTLSLDIAMMITSAPSAAGNAEVLANVVLTPAKPTFGGAPDAYQQVPASADFGAVHVVNPNGLTMNYDPQPGQGFLTRVALRSWVPVTGTGAHQNRHVVLPLAKSAAAGSYLTLSMSHAGIPVDCEIQTTMVYTLG